MKHPDFVSRLRQRIAAVQGAKAGDISVARAAKSIDVPETTLRSTLDGCYPRSEVYWRKLRTYTESSLDWLICGLGQPPEENNHRRAADRVLVVDTDLDKINLIRLALKGFWVEVARTATEAALLIQQNVYDLIISGEDMPWSPESLDILVRRRQRPRLLVVAGDPPDVAKPIHRICDASLIEPLSAEGVSSLAREQLLA